MKINDSRVPLKFTRFSVGVLIILLLLITPSVALLANAHGNIDDIKTITPEDLDHEQWLMDEVSRQAQFYHDDINLTVESENIPQEFLEEITIINLMNQGISGNIPASIKNLSNLRQVILLGNQLSGNIPEELGQLSSLDTLWLQSNQLSGSIPAELGQLTSLTELRLSDNQLSGSIPAELGQLTDLHVLALERNQLSGSIPAELGQLTSLVWLNFFDNQLSGSIPAELGQLSSLNFLWLQNNQLVGQIPSEFLSNNNLDLRVNNNGLTINSNNSFNHSDFNFISSSTAYHLTSVETIEISSKQPVIEPFNTESNTFFNLEKRGIDGNLSPLLEGHIFTIYEGEDTTQAPIYEGHWDEEIKLTVNPSNSVFTVVMDHAFNNDNNVTQIALELSVLGLPVADTDCQETGTPANLWIDSTGVEWCVVADEGEYTMLVTRHVHNLRGLDEIGLTRYHSSNEFVPWEGNAENPNGPEIRGRVNTWFNANSSDELRERVVDATVPILNDTLSQSAFEERNVDRTALSMPVPETMGSTTAPFFMSPADINVRFNNTQGFHVYWLRSPGSGEYSTMTLYLPLNKSFLSALPIHDSTIRPAIWVRR